MIDRTHSLPVTRQCQLLGLNRSSVYYQPTGVTDEDLQLMGISALYPKANTSRPGKGHRIYPRLLKGLNIDRPNRVWATDISYIPMARGFVYVVAIMDWPAQFLRETNFPDMAKFFAGKTDARVSIPTGIATREPRVGVTCSSATVSPYDASLALGISI